MTEDAALVTGESLAVALEEVLAVLVAASVAASAEASAEAASEAAVQLEVGSFFIMLAIQSPRLINFRIS